MAAATALALISTLSGCKDATSVNSPAQVQRLSAYPALQDGVVVFEWDDVAGATGYRLYRLAPDGTRTRLTDIPFSAERYYELAGLQHDELGTYALAAVGEGGEGPASEPASATAGTSWHFVLDGPIPGQSVLSSFVVGVVVNPLANFVATIEDRSADVIWRGGQGVVGQLYLDGLGLGPKQLVIRSVPPTPDGDSVVATIALTLVAPPGSPP